MKKKSFASSLRIVIALLCFSCCLSISNGQDKFGRISLKKILQKLPEAHRIKNQMYDYFSKWYRELSDRQSNWQEKYEEFRKNESTMNQEDRHSGEKELEELHEQIKGRYEQHFGQHNDEYIAFTGLMQPLEMKIYYATLEAAYEEGIKYVYDWSDYINVYIPMDAKMWIGAPVPRDSIDKFFDLTQKVLQKLLQGETKSPDH